MIIPAQYDAHDIIAKGFREGLAAVRIGDYRTGKWGFIKKP